MPPASGLPAGGCSEAMYSAGITVCLSTTLCAIHSLVGKETGARTLFSSTHSANARLCGPPYTRVLSFAIDACHLGAFCSSHSDEALTARAELSGYDAHRGLQCVARS